MLAPVLWDCTHTVCQWKCAAACEQMAGGVTEELTIADCCGCVAGVDKDCFDENVGLQLQLSLCLQKICTAHAEIFSACYLLLL